MVRLTSTISRLSPKKVLVVGDLMLDTYTIGKARRISPEAPVAVLQVLREEHRPGGAGNVALNLISMGAIVSMVGRIGFDSHADLLKKSLQDENIDIQGVIAQPGFTTPVKNRIIAENQQIVRVDHEKVTPLNEQMEQQLIEALPQLLKDVSVVAVSDYGKGFLTSTLLRALISQAKKRNIPVIADPKGIDFTKYKGSTMIKPNLSEAYAAAGLGPDVHLDLVAKKILQISDADVLLVTRSEAGISIYTRGDNREDFPVRVREVKDVTGAGDTVLAMLACAIANGLDFSEAAQLSNIAAGIAIERFGCARVSLSDLAHRLLELDVSNKVFDDEHLFALQEALRGRKYTLLELPEAQGLTSSIFHTIKQLGHEEDRDLLVYLPDEPLNEEFVSLLASLQEVKFIIASRNNLRTLCQKMHPEAIFSLAGSERKQFDSIEQLC